MGSWKGMTSSPRWNLVGVVRKEQMYPTLIQYKIRLRDIRKPRQLPHFGQEYYQPAVFLG